MFHCMRRLPLPSRPSSLLPSRQASSSVQLHHLASIHSSWHANSSDHVPSASKSSLGWVAAEHREEVSRTLELAERASRSWDVVFTDFLSPPVAADAASALSGIADIVTVPWGGYPQAERCRLAIGREDIMSSVRESPQELEGVAVINIQGNFMFDPATHRDFLGAMLGTGVRREAVGDILVQGELGAQALVAEHIVEHFTTELTKVRTVPVEVTAVPLSQLRVKAPKVEEITSIESSLRVDAVASAGFRMSRGKMADFIKAGDLRVNWRPVLKPSTEVKAGDMLSCSGKGRVEVKSVDMTKKDKYKLCMVVFT